MVLIPGKPNAAPDQTKQLHGWYAGKAIPQLQTGKKSGSQPGDSDPVAAGNDIDVRLTLPTINGSTKEQGFALRFGARMHFPAVGTDSAVRVWAKAGGDSIAGKFFVRGLDFLQVPYWGRFSLTGDGPNGNKADHDDGLYAAIDLGKLKLSGSAAGRFTPFVGATTPTTKADDIIDFAGATLSVGCPNGKACKGISDYQMRIAMAVSLAMPFPQMGNIGLFGTALFDSHGFGGSGAGMLIDGKLKVLGWTLAAAQIKLTSQEITLTAGVNLGTWTFADLVKIELGTIALQLKLDFAQRTICGGGKFSQKKNDDFAEAFDCTIGVCLKSGQSTGSVGAGGGFVPVFGCGTRCLSDSMCPKSETCYLGTCKAKMANGVPCTKETNCKSGACWSGFCAECSPVKGGCAADKFCNNGGACQTKLKFGDACVGVDKGFENDWCASGRCDGTCVDCWPPGHPGYKSGGDTCASDRFCSDGGSCDLKLGGGKSCFSTELFTGVQRRCASGNCGDPAWTCRDCDVGGLTCSKTAWCDTLLNYCKPKQSDGGACIQSGQCLSGACSQLTCYTPKSKGYGASCKVHLACKSGQCLAKGSCGCNGDDARCGSGEFCGAFGSCEKKKGIYAVCTSNKQCASGACAGLCYKPSSKGYGGSCKVTGECTTGQCLVGGTCGCNGKDALCGSGKFCALSGLCATKNTNGTPCTSATQCQGGHCNGKCASCTNDSHCGSGTFCDGLTGSCVAKKADHTLCTAAGQCKSGYCNVVCYSPGSKGYGASCKVQAECTTSQCLVSGTCGCNGKDSVCSASGKWCSGAGVCANKMSNGSPCSSANHCAGGYCSTVCASCLNDGHCGGGQYCGGGSCHNKVGNGTTCGWDSVCQSGHCAGVCVQCTSDGHCGDKQRCLLGACQNLKGYGTKCTSGSACIWPHKCNNADAYSCNCQTCHFFGVPYSCSCSTCYGSKKCGL